MLPGDDAVLIERADPAATKADLVRDEALWTGDPCGCEASGRQQVSAPRHGDTDCAVAELNRWQRES